MELNAVVFALGEAELAGARPLHGQYRISVISPIENAISLMLIAESGVRVGHESVVTVPTTSRL